MSLEDNVQHEYDEIGDKMKKIMVVSDAHAPFYDKKNLDIARKYAKEYKPDVYVMAGDMVDFYSISKFDRDPKRKQNVASEVQAANYCLDFLLEGVPKHAKKVFIEGNHEYRLQSYIWKDPALYGLEAVDIKSLLHLEERGVDLIRADGDYWKKNQSYKIGDTLILHGDNRLDGASTSRYSGYSAKNTVQTMMNNVVMGHVHRGGIIYQTTPNGILVGAEAGKLCQDTGTANWQSGFITFEQDKGKSSNFRFHHIQNGQLKENGKVYKGRKR